jgi:hypothetical protein
MPFFSSAQMKALSTITTLELFVEKIRPPFEECRIGFRRQDGEIVSQIIVSANLLRDALYSDFSIDLTLSTEGLISASLGEGTNDVNPRSVRAIDDLLRITLMNRNLYLEEASTCQLRKLLARLEDSVTMVRRAIDHMPNSE